MCAHGFFRKERGEAEWKGTTNQRPGTQVRKNVSAAMFSTSSWPYDWLEGTGARGNG